LAIDSKSDHKANAYKPARDMVPDGAANTSRPESGGQLYNCNDVAPTPSMRSAAGRHPSPADPSQPRPDKAPGGAVSD